MLKKEETEVPGENSHKARTRTNNKHMAFMLVFKPRPHLWEANAFTTTPPLHSTHQWGIYIKGGPKGINDQLRDSLGTHDSLKGSGTQLLIHNNFKKIQT